MWKIWTWKCFSMAALPVGKCLEAWMRSNSQHIKILPIQSVHFPLRKLSSQNLFWFRRWWRWHQCRIKDEYFRDSTGALTTGPALDEVTTKKSLLFFPILPNSPQFSPIRPDYLNSPQLSLIIPNSHNSPQLSLIFPNSPQFSPILPISPQFCLILPNSPLFSAILPYSSQFS